MSVFVAGLEFLSGVLISGVDVGEVEGPVAMKGSVSRKLANGHAMSEPIEERPVID